MIILGIETSCDETSAAVLQDGRLLSNITVVQYVHTKYGGVVPELASRAHQKLIVPIVQEALTKAHIERNEIDAVAAVHGPGLAGALLVGLSFGKALAMALNVPFIGVNHMEAHILSNFIGDRKPKFPYVNLTVSGGHTQLVLVKDFFSFQLLGETVDDAAGEAFDKVAKMLGIGYPGGPLIGKHASGGNPHAVEFPRPYLEKGSMNFSFSGLKTSVLYYLRKSGFDKAKADGKWIADVCASFQAAVVDVLAEKLISAAKTCGVGDIAVVGGVSANAALRRRLESEAQRYRLNLFLPEFEFCTDNGAMVAMAVYEKMKQGIRSSLELTAEPNLQLAS